MDFNIEAYPHVSKIHIESFNEMLNCGLLRMIQRMIPLQMELPNGDKLEIKLVNCMFFRPVLKKCSWDKIYPAECRSRRITYKGTCMIDIDWSLNGKTNHSIRKAIGEMPVMLQSNICHLRNLTSEQLVTVGEEEKEFGGYFIIDGEEKVIRLLMIQRRNYPLAMKKDNWKNIDSLFTEYGISCRSVADDHCGITQILHYLSNGTVQLGINYKGRLHYIQVMILIKALVDKQDFEIFEYLVKEREKDAHYKSCIANMLREVTNRGIVTQRDALNNLGRMFSSKLDLPTWYTNADVAKHLLKNSVLIHLISDEEKFHFLVFMVKKLFALKSNMCSIESLANPMNQEVLLPGQLYTIVLKEKLYSWLTSLRFFIEKNIKNKNLDSIDEATLHASISRTMDVSRPILNFFSTGNFIPKYEGSLKETLGLSVVADRQNFLKFLSHFRAVHLTNIFSELKTPDVRKLYPEAWGFLCPVQTPPGTSCGLLNHLSALCEITTKNVSTEHLVQIFCNFGMIPLGHPISSLSSGLSVLIDGKVLGWIAEKLAIPFVMKLRQLKSKMLENVPKYMEICLVPKTAHASQFPGIFIFTTASRMMRPVKSLPFDSVEFIGTMEQVYLHIAVDPKELVQGVTFHQELTPTVMLSIMANMIPYSDSNQSSMNIYACQISKQAMGTPCHSLKYRSDKKLYFIQTPQSPIVRPKIYDCYHLNDYPVGTNAIVAVISYTGFDLKDNIILNKSSIERGFKDGSIYVTKFIDLVAIGAERSLGNTLVFGRKEDKFKNLIDTDGFPYIGARVQQGDPICSYICTTYNEVFYETYESIQEGYVHGVKLLGSDTVRGSNHQVCIKFRIPRRTSVGYSFATRHGQKSICSRIVKTEDLPFTESGIIPDLIINPHSFPSRITIGMIVESMAGKYAALNGTIYDATPFQFTEENSAVNYFGECLKKAGFDYYGIEKMYSGVDGGELETDIFVGVVYYQRLIHMLSDKYQVRTTGPVERHTRQPFHNPNTEDALMFSEMEKDVVIASGASAILHDRLQICSDLVQQYACSKCENIFSPFLDTQENFLNNIEYTASDWTCRLCGTNKYVCSIDLPHVFLYFNAELSAVNIKVNLKLTDRI